MKYRIILTDKFGQGNSVVSLRPELDSKEAEYWKGRVNNIVKDGRVRNWFQVRATVQEV